MCENVKSNCFFRGSAHVITRLLPRQLDSSLKNGVGTVDGEISLPNGFNLKCLKM